MEGKEKWISGGGLRAERGAEGQTDRQIGGRVSVMQTNSETQRHLR